MNKFRCSHSRVEGNPTLKPLIFLLYSNAEPRGVWAVEAGKTDPAKNLKIFDCFFCRDELCGSSKLNLSTVQEIPHKLRWHATKRANTLDTPPEHSQVIYVCNLFCALIILIMAL